MALVGMTSPVWTLVLLSLLLLISNTNTLKSLPPPTDGGRIVKEHTSYEAEFSGCSYQGYSPYFATTITKMNHVTASLQLSAMDNAWISAETAKRIASVNAFQEAMDGTNEFTRRVLHLSETGKKTVGDTMTRILKGAAKISSVLSPVIGIVAASLEGVIAVATPTYEDILGATTKALKRLTNDVDSKMAQAMEHAGEIAASLEKDLNVRKYTFLYTHWTQCILLETTIEIDLCQRESYRLIVASIDDFLLFREEMDGESGTSSGLTNKKRRRIEVNMVSFRNYAMLALLSLKTLAETYDKERQSKEDKDSNQKWLKSCSEMKKEERKQKKLARDSKTVNKYSSPSKLKFYCTFEEELITKARYFEKYGKRAIEEIIIVARSRTEIEWDDDKEYEGDSNIYNLAKKFVIANRPVLSLSSMPESVRAGALKGTIHWERRLECSTQLHPSKLNHKCSYDITLLEKPSMSWRYDLPDHLKSLSRLKGEFKTAIDTLLNTEGWQLTAYLTDWRAYEGVAGPGSPTLSSRSCHKRIEKRRDEYRRREAFDIRRYWSKEVMKVVTCGRVLAERIEKDCEDEALRRHVPEAFEEVIKVKSTSGRGFVNPNRAVDGLLSTSSEILSGGSFQNPEWEAELEETVKINQIQVYIDSPTGNQEATAKLYIIDYEGQRQELNDVTSKRRKDGYFVFYASSVLSDWSKYKRYVLTDNVGKVITYGSYNGHSYGENYWSDESNWSYKDEQSDGYKIVLDNFKGSRIGIFNKLKVETAPAFEEPNTKPDWSKCAEIDSVDTPYMDTPLNVNCDEGDEATRGNVKFIQLTVNDAVPRGPRIAEVVVIGLPVPLQADPAPTEMVIDIKSASQSSTQADERLDNDGSAENAIDTLLSTWSETQEDTGSSWWKGELDAETTVRKVKVELYGEYTKASVDVSATGVDDEEWTKCGEDKQNINNDNVLKGHIWQCTVDSPVKFVRVTGVSKRDDGKSTLKIREVYVTGPYVEPKDEEKDEPKKRKERKRKHRKSKSM